MPSIEKIGSDMNDLLKQGEHAIENVLDTDIDIFTESKEQIDAANKKAIEKAQAKAHEATIDVRKDVVKTNILNQLTTGYNATIDKINQLPDLGDSKQKTLNEIKTEYESIKKIIEGYNNDGEFKKGFNLVNTKISNWINTLQTKKADTMNQMFAGDIIDSSIHSLNILKADLSILNGATKDSIEQSKTQLTSKFEEKSEGTEEATSMLSKIGIPAGIAGIVAGLGKSMGFFGFSKNGEKGILSKFMDILKNPLKGFMGLFGFGDNKISNSESSSVSTSIMKDNTLSNNQSKDNSETNTEISSSQLIKTTEGERYTYNNISLETKNGDFSEILIGNVKYQVNISNQPDIFLGDINFEKRNNKDILKIGDTEVDLLTTLKQVDEKNIKDRYTLVPDYRLMGDLVIEKIA